MGSIFSQLSRKRSTPRPTDPVRRASQQHREVGRVETDGVADADVRDLVLGAELVEVSARDAEQRGGFANDQKLFWQHGCARKSWDSNGTIRRHRLGRRSVQWTGSRGILSVVECMRKGSSAAKLSQLPDRRSRPGGRRFKSCFPYQFKARFCSQFEEDAGLAFSGDARRSPARLRQSLSPDYSLTIGNGVSGWVR